MTDATQMGVSETEATQEAQDAQEHINPRLAFIEDMAGRLNEQRHDELQETMEVDPGLKQNQLAMEGLAEKEENVDTSDEQNTDAEKQVAAETKQSNGELPDFIVHTEEGYFFKSKVDGEERMIPVDRARDQLQKSEAAETRLHFANQKMQELRERENRLAAIENSLQQRAATSEQHPPSSKKEDVDDEEALNEAKELVNVLFSENEDEAAKKLAQVLGKNRASASQQPSIDPNELVNRTEAAVMSKLHQERIEQDVKGGFTEFAKDYPEIAQDPNLFRVADDMSTQIAAEHPDWWPSQVMSEAGKRTKEWLDSQRSSGLEDNLDDDPGEEPEPSSKPDIRQTRKAQLKPMPRSGSVRHQTPAAEKPQTPAEALAEMRAARGQPV